MGRGTRGVTMSSPAALRASAGSVPQEQFDVASVLAELADRVHSVDMDALQAKLKAKGRMTNYGTDVLDSIQEQAPHATRIAGKRAWANRGRRLKPNATPIRIGAGKRIYEPARHPRTGTVIENPRVTKMFGLKPTLVGYERTQDVYDIADTEPITAPVRTAAELAAAERLIADLTAVAERDGVRVYRGGVPNPGSDAERLVNRSLLETRDADGSHVKIRTAEGNLVRAVATPGGSDVVEDALILAHEVGHARLGHADVPDVIRRLESEDHELEAEAFAHAVARRYGLDWDASAEYIAHWSRKRRWALKRTFETAGAAVGAFLDDVGR